MRTLAIVAILALLIPAAGTAHAQTNVTVDPATLNLGFMNVFLLDGVTGAGINSGWGFGDLTAVYSGNNLTLGPNTIGDPNEFWYQCVPPTLPPNCGEPGAPGNKIMEANSYAQVDDALGGQIVIFSGVVTAYSLTSAHPVIAFIRDFAPDFSSFNESSIPLTGTGAFSLNLATDPGAGRHVQWGFQMKGVNVWADDVGQFGSITIAPEGVVPTEDANWGAVKSLYR